MPEILSPGIARYLAGLESPATLEAPHDRILAEMERHAEERNFPYIGPHVGRVLYLLARLTGARRVLEMGSGFGYSAYWFALGMGPGGVVTLTEYSREDSQRAREFFRQGGIEGRGRFLVGDALELVAREPGPFDIILCDIDKRDYPKVPGLVKPKLRAGGLLLVDNMLWSGRVAEPEPDANTRAIQELARTLYADPDFFTTTLPIRDGVTVSLKRGAA